MTVITGFTDQLASDMENVVEHLEGHHADTVHFIATHAAPIGRDEATDSAIAALDPSGVTFRVTDGADQAERRVDFPAAVGSLPELQAQLFAMIHEARAAAPDHPQTSIEHELATTAELRTWMTEVRHVQRLTDNLVEITLGGLGLNGMPTLGGDEFFQLIPLDPDRPDQITAGMAMSDIQAIPDDERPAGAYYTTRRRRPHAGELDVWVVLHDHDGGVSGWAAHHAVPGAAVALWGPRRGYEPPPTTTSHLLICDETGLPAALAITEALPADHPVTLIAETIDADHRPPVPARPALDLRWVERGDAAPGTAGALLAAVEGLDMDLTGVYAVGAAESREISAVRRHLRNERGLTAEQVHMTGYWRR